MAVHTRRSAIVTCEKLNCPTTQYVADASAGQARIYARNHFGWGIVANKDYCGDHMAQAKKKFEQDQQEASANAAR